ncbi:MAG: hypothetical protein QW756_00950 [Nitrososphaerota archaeon]
MTVPEIYSIFFGRFNVKAGLLTVELEPADDGGNRTVQMFTGSSRGNPHRISPESGTGQQSYGLGGQPTSHHPSRQGTRM